MEKPKDLLAGGTGALSSRSIVPNVRVRVPAQNFLASALVHVGAALHGGHLAVALVEMVAVGWKSVWENLNFF